ncbi:hypothetical protein N7481_006430 [Penicillium waksmanii]|uniref:uncharacterized protein n=1 Tax=Penicillium waksmanii TaxID=69791 RepID=UPI002547C426|nr:uncharacterized protein N7481_006430 [Penicillium waksmanii]KAJ5984331.1 hypothetical protein N7481_006430 [Penicillium waksmanii]
MMEDIESTASSDSSTPAYTEESLFNRIRRPFTAMAHATRDERAHPGSETDHGPPEPPPIHPSFVHVAKPYLFEQTIQDCIQAMGLDATREASQRLQGVTWIDNVRKALRLPIRTFNTAVLYYHRYRLVRPDNEYSFTDTAAAALFTACKIEDTLKKSREILCAAHNLKYLPSEHLSPDDQAFEASSRAIIGLERLMLECSGFDFRTRHPEKTLAKMSLQYKAGSKVSSLAYRISLDLYRTFSPLKQTTPTMALACLELAGRLLDERIEDIESGADYAHWKTSRTEVMETLFDLLELYTDYRALTSVGPEFQAPRFLTVRIPLNKEANSQRIPRYNQWFDRPRQQNVSAIDGSNDKQPDTPQRPHHPLTPVAANGDRLGASERGRDAAVRFTIDSQCAADEKRQVEPYFKVEMEEYEVEV